MSTSFPWGVMSNQFEGLQTQVNIKKNTASWLLRTEQHPATTCPLTQKPLGKNKWRHASHLRSRLSIARALNANQYEPI